MSWLVQEELSQKELAQSFFTKMKDPNILNVPGSYDSLTGLIAKETGFEALYLSGAAYTASRGLPDLGMIHSEEIAARAKDIVRATNLPLLVDIDTGFGEVINVARTAKEMVEAGVAAVQIEDQKMPKKCGHLNGKTLIETEDMVNKIRAIKETAPNLIVIARTDAKSVSGLEEVITRAEYYRKAGADGIFPEALATEQEFKTAGDRIHAPLLANMTEFGRTPYFTARQFEEWGFDMVIYPVTALRTAAKAVENVYQELIEKGTQKDMLDHMQTRSELYETISYYDYEKLDEKISSTILPNAEKKDE